MWKGRVKRRVFLTPGAVCWFLGIILMLGLTAPARAGYDLVVAQDGSGDYTTVQAAILAVPARRPGRTEIFIKAGTYHEKITIPRSRPRLTLVGEDRDTTVITNDEYTLVRGVDPLDTVTCYVQAKDFGARNVTFANTAGDVGEASFAMWIEGTRAHFRNCALLGYQDTMYMPTEQAYFKRCFIEGAIDFIYGPAMAVFKDCTIHCIGGGYITAADTDEGQAYGLVFKDCTIYGTAPAASVHLGRALGAYANVVYSNCVMDDEIAPEGWDDFGDPSRQDTVFFAEYDSSGAGSDPADRVDWSRQLTAEMDAGYSLDKIFGLSTSAVATQPWYADY